MVWGFMGVRFRGLKVGSDINSSWVRYNRQGSMTLESVIWA